MPAMKLQLLDNASASSSGLHSIPVDGQYVWLLEGTFNGGSYQLQASNANGTLVDVPGATMSAAGRMHLSFTAGTLIKLVETGATSAMYSTLVGPAPLGSVLETGQTNAPMVVGGAAAHDAAVSGNPVRVAGKAASTAPAAVAVGDVADVWTGLNGQVVIGSPLVAGADGMGNSSLGGLANSSNGVVVPMGSVGHKFNGTTWDRDRGNVDVTVFASAARTATPTPFDGVNYNGKGLHLVIDCTAIAASPSVVFTLQGLDAISGKFYTILASAAIVGTGTTVLRVYPGLTVAANLVASDILPRNYRVIATHGDADSITYTVGASLIL